MWLPAWIDADQVFFTLSAYNVKRSISTGSLMYIRSVGDSIYEYDSPPNSRLPCEKLTEMVLKIVGFSCGFPWRVESESM